MSKICVSVENKYSGHRKQKAANISDVSAMCHYFDGLEANSVTIECDLYCREDVRSLKRIVDYLERLFYEKKQTEVYILTTPIFNLQKGDMFIKTINNDMHQYYAHLQRKDGSCTNTRFDVTTVEGNPQWFSRGARQ